MMRGLAGSTTVLAVMLAVVGSPARAAPGSMDSITLPIEQAAYELDPNQFVWQDTNSGEAVSIVVSLSTQRAFVYRGSTMIAATTISSGKDAKGTPVGTYPILQKNESHRSNLYNDAPMPFMQRLTWDGIAIHAGRNPGFPDSHGCIRVPTGFAKRLFGITALGTTVTVTDDFEGGALPREPLVDAETARANARQLTALAR